MNFIGVISAIVAPIATPDFVNAISILTEKRSVVGVTPPIIAVLLVRAVRAKGIAVAAFEPSVASRVIGGRTQSIVAGERGRTGGGQAAELIVTADAIPDT